VKLVAGISISTVVARSPENDIAGRAIQRRQTEVAASSANDAIVTGPTSHVVPTCTTEQPVVASLTVLGEVGASSSPDNVVPRTSRSQVLTRATHDPIVSPPALDEVRATAREDDVVAT